MNFIKKNLKKIVLAPFLVYILGMIFVPSIIYSAQNPPCNPSDGKICNPIPSVTSIPGLIQIFLEGALKIGIPVVALAIIYCGFLFVFARGNSEKLGKAKDALLYTLIGAAILLGSWAIAKMISATVTGLGS